MGKDTLLLDTPPVSGQILFQCCPGDKAGFIVSITFGCFLIVLIIVGIICAVKRFRKNTLLRDRNEEN